MVKQNDQHNDHPIFTVPLQRYIKMKLIAEAINNLKSNVEVRAFKIFKNTDEYVKAYINLEQEVEDLVLGSIEIWKYEFSKNVGISSSGWTYLETINVGNVDIIRSDFNSNCFDREDDYF